MKLTRIPFSLGLAALAFFFWLGKAQAANPDIAAGDAAYAVRTATAGAAEALEHYKAAFGGTDGAQARWKAARALHWMGDQGGGKKSDRAKAFEQGIIYAKEAVGAAQNRPETHFWLAALYGSYGELKGVMKSLSLIAPIRAQLEEVNRIDEKYQGGAGLRVLGIVDYKVPGFAGGSNKRARERLTRALTLGPDNPYNHYYMGEFLFETGKKEDAARHLDTLAHLGVSADVDAPDLASIQAKGALLRKKIRS